MEEEIFDESQLFSTFESAENGDDKMKVPKLITQLKRESASLSELDSLKKENLLLKKLVRKIGFNPSEDEPLANILFYNGACSRGKQGEFEDFICHVAGKPALNSANKNSDVSSEFIPSGKKTTMCDGFAAAFGQIDYTKLEYDDVEYDIAGLPVGCIQYFTSFCLDKFGSEVEQVFPNPPHFERVYFRTLPAEAGSKIPQRRKLVCFNCDGDHRLNDCTKRRDLARISMKRNEFMAGRTNDSRYHEDQAKIEKYQHLVPGKVSEKLREALALVEHDLPPFIYRMRMLGYPSGWLPQNDDSGIVLYGKEGKEGKEEEESSESNHLDPNKYVHFPGFNVPIPRVCKDLANDARLPVMHPREQLDVKPEEIVPPSENENGKRSLEDGNSGDHKNKKMRTTSENDMEIETDGEAESSNIETVKPSNNNTGSQRNELEDGEIAGSPGTDQTDGTPQSTLWWLKEPLVTHLKNANKEEFVPPPFPLTPLPLHKISQILPGEVNHISFEDRSRWLDPIFGNLQVRTGRYDKLKIILANRENKRKSL